MTKEQYIEDLESALKLVSECARDLANKNCDILIKTKTSPVILIVNAVMALHMGARYTGFDKKKKVKKNKCRLS